MAPNAVLIERFQGQVAQSGVFRDTDAVLAARPPTVPQLEGGELPAGRVRGERGQAVTVDVIEPQLRAGVCRSRRTMTRIPGGHFVRSRIPVNSATSAPGRPSSAAL